jgi:hypothetical protein
MNERVHGMDISVVFIGKNVAIKIPTITPEVKCLVTDVWMYFQTIFIRSTQKVIYSVPSKLEMSLITFLEIFSAVKLAVSCRLKFT